MNHEKGAAAIAALLRRPSRRTLVRPVFTDAGAPHRGGGPFVLIDEVTALRVATGVVA